MLGEYYAALMKAPAPNDPDDDKWLEEHTIDSAAFRLAFLWVRYGVAVSESGHARSDGRVAVLVADRRYAPAVGAVP